MGMRAVNTYAAKELEAHAIYSGPTHWNTNGMHRLDYWLASPSIKITGLWGDHRLTTRWQHGANRDHLATRMRFSIMLPTTIIPLSGQERWDWRSLQVALEDHAMRLDFQKQVWEWWSQDEELQAAARDMTPAGVEKHWCMLQAGVKEIASRIFLRPERQRKPWTTEDTL